MAWTLLGVYRFSVLYFSYLIRVLLYMMVAELSDFFRHCSCVYHRMSFPALPPRTYGENEAWKLYHIGTSIFWQAAPLTIPFLMENAFSVLLETSY